MLSNLFSFGGFFGDRWWWQVLGNWWDEKWDRTTNEVDYDSPNSFKARETTLGQGDWIYIWMNEWIFIYHISHIISIHCIICPSHFHHFWIIFLLHSHPNHSFLYSSMQASTKSYIIYTNILKNHHNFQTSFEHTLCTNIYYCFYLLIDDNLVKCAKHKF